MNSKYDIFKLRDSLPEEERNLYEVLPGTTNRKIYFDFDKQGEQISVYDFMSVMNAILPACVKKLFNAELDMNDIIYTDSSTEDKSSFHVVVPVFNLSVANMKMLYKLVK